MSYKNRCLYLILISFIFLLSCNDDRASSVTGSQSSATSGDVTLAIQVSRTKVGLGETIDITLSSTCNSCLFGEGDYDFSYTSNSKIDAASGTGTFTIDEDEFAASVGITFTGIEAAARGTAVITGTGGGISVSTEVTIE